MSYVRSGGATTITTSATGAATVYSTVLNGLIKTVKVVCVGTTSTADIVVTGEVTTAPILTKANLTKSSTNWFHPRAVANKVADGATTSGVPLVPVMNERIKTVMLGGGNAQSYTIEVFVV